MSDIWELYEKMGICREVYGYGQGILEELEERFQRIDHTAEHNQLKVVKSCSP